MWKWFVILGLLPVFAAMIARQAARGRRADRPVDGAPAAGDLARSLLAAAGHEALVKPGGLLALPGAPRGPVRLPRGLIERRDPCALGVAVQEVGLHLLAAEASPAVAMRLRVLWFGAAGPAFAAMVAVFAAIAMRGALAWIVAAVVLVAGLASLLLLLTTAVELQAAARGAAALRRLPLPLDSADLARIEQATRAAAWRRSLPVSLAWLAP